VLREHCRAVGRPYDEIEKTGVAFLKRVTADGAGGTVTPSQLVDTLGEQAELGIEHVIVGLDDVWELSQLELLGRDVVPAVARLP